jgi:hypothetical protein
MVGQSMAGTGLKNCFWLAFVFADRHVHRLAAVCGFVTAAYYDSGSHSAKFEGRLHRRRGTRTGFGRRAESHQNRGSRGCPAFRRFSNTRIIRLFWEAQINSVLGPDFPYFVTIGNHDELAWKGPEWLSTIPDQSIQSSWHHLDRRSRRAILLSLPGLFFVNTAPGISSGFDNGHNDSYIRDQLAADNSVWSICSWHKDMKLMQVGGKEDETGWGVLRGQARRSHYRHRP